MPLLPPHYYLMPPALLRRTLRGLQRVRDDLRVLARGLALVLAAAPGTAAAYVTLVIILNLLPVVQVWLTKLVVDQITGGAAGLSSPAMTTALILAALYVLTLVVPAGMQPIQAALAAWLEDRAVREVDHRLMRAGGALVDLSRLERPAFQDELRVLQISSYSVPRLFHSIQDGLGIGLTLTGLLLLLGQLHPLLPLVLAGVSAPHLVAERRLGQLVHEAMTRHSRAAREMDYYARVTTEPAAAKEVRVFALGSFFLQRFRERYATAFAEVHRLRLSHLDVAVGFSAGHAVALAGGFWYVSVLAGLGRLTLGDVALYLFVLIQAETRMLVLTVWIGRTYGILLHVRALLGFLESARPAITLPSRGRGQPAPPGFRQGIALRHVRFRYPESDRWVLDDVSAVLPAGRVTALVGTNGAGKSTLVKLLTRMYDPAAGEILLDGVPLAAYDLADLRRRIAVVYQDFARFALTLRENIAVGLAAYGDSDGRVEQAARWAGADEVAARLPQSYNTPLTRRFEGGVELSGGEWQKVALARAFVRDAALIILDEPTAALDAEAEEQLFEHFRELVAGKTALLISHRFSTVRMADYILVLEGGRIIEAGSHAELVALGGRYATLYELQAKQYR
jgi:ATP-binding cassette subfamily B protein